MSRSRKLTTVKDCHIENVKIDFRQINANIDLYIPLLISPSKTQSGIRMFVKLFNT